MEKINFYLINASIVPDIYKKVITAKSLLASGKAKSASQAAKMADISRSAYYKYKDAIFEYHGDDSSDTATINAKLMDNAGVLSSLMNELYKAGANRAYSFGSRCFRNRANCRDDRYKRRITKFN